MIMRPVHPGEVLAEELTELGISPAELARQLNVPANRVSQILHGQRAVTGDTAIRLAHWFDMSADFWINLQAQYDVALARKKLGADLDALPRRKTA
ncbi:MAG: HigA family addiction module antitoxin [Devosia sp.]|nr:HigA family addiction module antitoxin [Devosia sp.]